MTRIADTSVLYALFDEDDAHHDAARSLVEENEPILVPREILVETIDLIAYRGGRTHARQALTSLLDLPHVNVAEPVHIGGVVETYRRSGTRLSLADAFVVQTCRVMGATALTFDRAIRGALKNRQ